MPASTTSTTRRVSTTESASEKSLRYIRALRYRWLTPLYDLLIRLFLRERRFKGRLVRQARVEGRHRVLDIGCGTGTLTLLVKRTQSGAEVVGLDGDPDILRIAREKAGNAGLDVAFDEGMSFDLPYPDASFDRVVTSLVLHHLSSEDKVRTLEEAYRVLRPGGELHVADWGRPQNVLMRLAFLSVQLLDGFDTTRDNAAGLLPQLFREADFTGVRQTARYMTIAGTLSLFAAKKVGSENPGIEQEA